MYETPPQCLVSRSGWVPPSIVLPTSATQSALTGGRGRTRTSHTPKPSTSHPQPRSRPHPPRRSSTTDARSQITSTNIRRLHIDTAKCPGPSIASATLLEWRRMKEQRWAPKSSFFESELALRDPTRKRSLDSDDKSHGSRRAAKRRATVDSAPGPSSKIPVGGQGIVAPASDDARDSIDTSKSNAAEGDADRASPMICEQYSEEPGGAEVTGTAAETTAAVEATRTATVEAKSTQAMDVDADVPVLPSPPAPAVPVKKSSLAYILDP